MNYNIDIFYKRIVTKAHSSVTNNSWDEFEKLLDNKTKKTKRFLVFFIADALFFCILFIWNYSIENRIINNLRINQRYSDSKPNSLLDKKDTKGIVKPKEQQREFVETFRKEDFKFDSKLLSVPIIETKKNDSYNVVFKELEKKNTKASLFYFDMAPPFISTVIKIKKPTHVPSRWTINIGLTNGNVYTNPITSTQNNNIHKNFVGLKNRGEQLNKFVSLQLIGNYKAKGGLSLLTGINYTAISQTVKHNFRRTEIPVFDSSGKGAIIGYSAVPLNQASPVLLEGNNQYYLLEIPIGAKLDLKINRRIIVTYSMGANASFLLGNMGQTIDPQTLEAIKLNKDNSPISKMNFSTNTSLGVDYMISNKTYWFIQAQYLKYFSPNSLDKNYKFSILALKIGLGFKLYK